MKRQPPEKGNPYDNGVPLDEDYLSSEDELDAFLRRRAGEPISEREARHLDGLHPGDIAPLEDIAKRRDAEDDDFRRAVAEHVPLGVPLGVQYPELKPLCFTSGHLDPAAIKEKFARPPSTLSLPEIEAMETILILGEDLTDADTETRFKAEALLQHAPWLTQVQPDDPKEWCREFFGVVLGMTRTVERVYNGEVVERTVEHHPGRGDVRAYRASLQSKPDAPATAPIRATARARGAGRPRAAASRSSAASGDSGDDPPAPPTPALRSVGDLRHIAETLEEELSRIAATLRVREGAGR